MKTEESFYIKVLIWSYENSAKGFTEEELFEKFKIIPNSTEYKLYLKLFKDGNSSTGNPSTIDQFEIRNEVGILCLTDRSYC